MFYHAGWPSGLRRCVQVAVSSDAWVRIPLLSAVFVLACRLAVKPSLKLVFQHIGTKNPTLMSRCNIKNKSSQKMFYHAGWPSGLRRCVQVAVSSDAWVRIPLLSAVFVLACRLAVETSLKFVFQHIGTNNPTLMSRCNNKNKSSQKMFHKAGWPSGLRRCVQVAVSSDAWVRIPLLSAVFVLACRLAVKTSLKFVFQHTGTNNPTLMSRCNNKNKSS